MFSKSEGVHYYVVQFLIISSLFCLTTIPEVRENDFRNLLDPLMRVAIKDPDAVPHSMVKIKFKENKNTGKVKF